jgi:hypothetical protein
MENIIDHSGWEHDDVKPCHEHRGVSIYKVRRKTVSSDFSEVNRGRPIDPKPKPIYEYAFVYGGGYPCTTLIECIKSIHSKNAKS